MFTRQRPSLRELLTNAKLELLPLPKQIKQAGFFPMAVSNIRMVISINFYVLLSNLKTK